MKLYNYSVRLKCIYCYVPTIKTLFASLVLVERIVPHFPILLRRVIFCQILYYYYFFTILYFIISLHCIFLKSIILWHIFCNKCTTLNLNQTELNDSKTKAKPKSMMHNGKLICQVKIQITK